MARSRRRRNRYFAFGALPEDELTGKHWVLIIGGLVSVFVVFMIVAAAVGSAIDREPKQQPKKTELPEIRNAVRHEEGIPPALPPYHAPDPKFTMPSISPVASDSSWVKPPAKVKQ